MIQHPPEVLQLLDEGRAEIRGLMRFEFGTGTYGFIRGRSELTWGGLTYVPGGIVEVSDLPSAIGMTAQRFTITLSASHEDGLTPDVLRTIEQEDYRDRPVRIYDAYFHPDTGALLDVKGLRRGYVDIIEHIEDDKRGYTLVANCETRALDYNRTNGRMRSDADQRLIKADDGFFKHVSYAAEKQLYWGGKKPAVAGQALGGVRPAQGMWWNDLPK